MTNPLRFGRAEMRQSERKLLLDGQPVALGARAFDVLTLLIAHRDRVVGKNELLEAVWPGLVVEENNLQVQISTLRKFLGASAITTIPGLGYRFTMALDDERISQVMGARAMTCSAEVEAPAYTSIAVLPFADISEKKDQEYFADGMAEEILNLLCRVPGLHVAARTSAFSFKGKADDIPTIAGKLRVANVLEGSVRKSGNRLRITAQLVRADSGYHVWSETYDRNLDDIFKVQYEIATTVVKALMASLLLGVGPKSEGTTEGAMPARTDVQPDSETAIVSARTASLLVDAVPEPKGTAIVEAYTLYLQARSMYARAATQAEFEKVFDYLQKALKLDETFAPAWAWLSLARSQQAGRGLMLLQEGYEEARQAAERALQLDRRLAEAYSAMGVVHLEYDWDWPGAESDLREALQIDPGNPSALRVTGRLARSLGRFDQSFDLFQKAVSNDPLNPRAHNDLGLVEYDAGRFSQAQVAYRKMLDLNPGQFFGHGLLGLAMLDGGDPPTAVVAEIERGCSDEERQLGRAYAYDAYVALNKKAEADTALVEQESKYADKSAFQFAEIHARRGEIDQAFSWLDCAYRTRDPGCVLVKGDRHLNQLWSDPRYRTFLRKMKLPE